MKSGIPKLPHHPIGKKKPWILLKPQLKQPKKNHAQSFSWEKGGIYSTNSTSRRKTASFLCWVPSPAFPSPDKWGKSHLCQESPRLTGSSGSWKAKLPLAVGSSIPVAINHPGTSLNSMEEVVSLPALADDKVANRETFEPPSGWLILWKIIPLPNRAWQEKRAPKAFRAGTACFDFGLLINDSSWV